MSADIEDLLFFSFLDNVEEKAKKFFKFSLIGVGFWIWNTLVLKWGLARGINIWFITAFNVGVGGLIKFLMLEKIFKEKKEKGEVNKD